MESKSGANRRYTNQRPRRTPPHITLRDHRLNLKAHAADGSWDLDDICDGVEAITGDRPARGTVSAVENGLRGASSELLSALEQVYQLPPGSITTDYAPRSTPASTDDAVA